MNEQMTKRMKYIRRAFLVPDTDPKKRVYVEWDGTLNRFVAGLETWDGQAWCETGARQITNSEESMWALAEGIWVREGGP